MKKASLLLALLMLASYSASCGTQSVGSGETTDAAETTISGETTAAPSEWVNPNVDYEGRKITVASLNYQESYTMLNYHIALDEDNGDVINDAIVERNRTVEDTLGIEIDIMPINKAGRSNTTKLSTAILAGDSEFDFALQPLSGLTSMITTEGMLVDLTSIKTLDLKHSWWNQQANDEYTLYGKQLLALGDISFFNLGAPIVTYFSKELIEDNKLENPYELVYEGKWTIDKLIEMSTAAARDLNGDQVIDDTDQFGLAAQPSTIELTLNCMGVRYTGREKDGGITVTLNNEKTINIVEKLVPFFNNKEVTLLDGMTKQKYTSPYLELFIPKLMQNSLLFYENQLMVALNLRAMEGDFGIIPVPKYDEAQENYCSFPNAAWTDHLIVPATTTDLDMIGNVIEAMSYYAQQIITPAFIDSTVFNKTLRDEDSAKMVEMILDNMVFDIGYLFNWGKMRSMFSDLVKSNNIGFASEYASKEAAVKSELASTIEMLNK